MDNFNALTPHILTWLLNYLVHSTLLLGLALITHQFGILKLRRFAELIWRAALFGGLVTASLQLGLQLALQAPEIKNESLSREQVIAPPSASFSPNMNEVSISDKRVQEASTIAVSPLPNDSTIKPQLTENFTRASDNKVITLSANLRNLISALVLTWLLYGVFSILKILRAVRHLNRMANAMPVIDRSDLNELLGQYLPFSNKTTRLRVSSEFNSPFVCPNGVICLPAWALEQSNKAVCQAMLHHEIQHIIRRDGAWRIAHELMKNIFFFQILNHAADKQLSLLAEIDCDRTAVRANGVDTFAQALVRCAEMAVASKHPTFAIPMAKSSSLLQRIDLILDEDIMTNNISKMSKNQASFRASALGLIAISGLSGFCYAIPAIQFNGEAATITTPNISSETTAKEAINIEAHVSAAIAKPDIAIDAKSVKSLPVEIKSDPSTLSNQPSEDTAVVKQQEQEYQLKQAQAAYESKNFSLALQLFSNLAKHGHAEAQFAAGDMLWRGEGSVVNPEAATVLLTQAAKQGHTKAQQYVALFAERAQRQTELGFYTQQFDGGKLKWTEQTCERPTFSSMLPSAKEYRDVINKLNANLTCYNNYVASLKQSLANEDYFNADLRRLMRTDEIDQSKQLARNVYFDMGTQAMQHSQQMLAEFDKKNEIWQSETKGQSGRHAAIFDEMLRRHFARVERRQVEIETGPHKTTTFTNLKEK